MANAIQWSALGSYTTIIAGADVAPTLKNLASAGKKLGNEIDNTGGNLYADFDLLCRFAAAASAGGYVALYFIQAVDGTNYADGGDAVVPPATSMAGMFPVRAVDTAQRVALAHILLPATKFKPLILNSGGQAFTNTSDENVLSYRTYTEEIQ